MKFSKTNPSTYSDALIKEANGLLSLKKHIDGGHISIKIPQIYSVNEQCLQLELINSLAGSKTQWQLLGQSLAQLHLMQQQFYGWHENNYIGLNPQTNTCTNDWGAFFINKRLAYQVSLIKQPYMQNQFKQSLASIQQPLQVLLNDHCPFPSLLHGDLWSGNVLFDEEDVWLIDPAVYCGDAEADLAMTELFGGFPATFYQAYTEVSPLSKHYALKKVIYNLYHQLNHLNLFGDAYLAACEQAFKTMEKYFNS